MNLQNTSPGPSDTGPRSRRPVMALVGLAATLILAAGVVVAQEGKGTPTSVGLGPGSTLTLKGGSNVHDWEARSTDVKLTLSRDPAQREPADAASIEVLVRSSGVRGLEVEVPVRSLHSKKDGLDKNLYKAMKAEQFPKVRFVLAGYTVTPNSGDTIAVKAPGKLTITNVERDVTLQGKLWKDAAGLWLVGMHPLKMTEFGIKPPTMMMGALRTHDRVEVHYRLLLVPSKTASANPVNSVTTEGGQS